MASQADGGQASAKDHGEKSEIESELAKVEDHNNLLRQELRRERTRRMSLELRIRMLIRDEETQRKLLDGIDLQPGARMQFAHLLTEEEIESIAEILRRCGQEFALAWRDAIKQQTQEETNAMRGKKKAVEDAAAKRPRH